MKKIATICVLILSISSSTVLAQSYKVIKVKETVKVNGKALQANQTIAIRDTDNITFEPSTAKAAIFSSSNGLAILSAPEKSSIQDIIEGQIKDDPMVFLHSLKWDQALNYARKMFPNEEDFPDQIDVYLV
ncbi:MAG: hypothetical protein AAF551_08905, partial [Bacteroidota bacterium]